MVTNAIPRQMCLKMSMASKNMFVSVCVGGLPYCTWFRENGIGLTLYL